MSLKHMDNSNSKLYHMKPCDYQRCVTQGRVTTTEVSHGRCQKADEQATDCSMWPHGVQGHINAASGIPLTRVIRDAPQHCLILPPVFISPQPCPAATLSPPVLQLHYPTASFSHPSYSSTVPPLLTAALPYYPPSPFLLSPYP